MIDGILVINKPKGITSFDCIAKLRKMLNIKQIGHTGTLDKEVTGVLVVCIGKACKLVNLLTDHIKEYEAILTLGSISETDDSYGKIIESKVPKKHSDDEIIDALNSFKGVYMQTPPIYSSIKKNGKKLYEYALKGEKVELEERRIEVYDINLLEHNNNDIKFNVKSSKGLYVRALCRDIAYKLDELGLMSYLIRTRVGDYTINDAINLDEVTENNIIPLIDVLDKFPKVEVKDYMVKLVKNGIELDERQTNISGVFAVTNNNEILALYSGEKKYKPIVIL